MRTPQAWGRTFATAAAVVGAAGLLVGAGGLQPHRPLVYAGLILAALLMAAFTAPQPAAASRGTMPPSFVLSLTALLLFGTVPATLVAVAAPVMRGRLARGARPHSPRRMLLNAVAAVVAMVAAGTAYAGLGGTTSAFAWPAQGLPILVAVLEYAIVAVVFAQIVIPLTGRQAIDHDWPVNILRECPLYILGGSLGVGLAELVHYRAWELAPVAAVPLYFAYRAHGDYVRRLDDEHRRRDAMDALEQGMAAVDEHGRVTLWNAALERLIECPRSRALGRMLGGAVPGLNDTALPRTIQAAMVDRKPRTLPRLGLRCGAVMRTFDLKILPARGGATVLWQEIAGKAPVDVAVKRGAERLALVAAGANDGLWEWDLRTQELYVSARWQALLGLSGGAVVATSEAWTGRVHPDDRDGLHAALEAHIAGTTDCFAQEHRLRHEDGTYRWFLARGVAEGGGRRASRIGGSLTDITDRRRAEERLHAAGALDPLTGLRTRADFVEALGRRLEEFKLAPGRAAFAVLYLDLDRFKVVNDSLGHLVGDELLVAVSRRLESCLREGDALSRLGGDEFAILLRAVENEGQANAVAFRIQDALKTPLLLGGREVFTTASIGIAVGATPYSSPDEIMRDADTAMYHAKANGKARHELFDSAMHARARDRLGLESDLRHAVESCDFEVHYQPIVLLSTRMCIGFESLVRWTRNGHAMSPAMFVPIAEEIGLIGQLGTWVLQQACLVFAEWQRRYPDAGLDYITVNASSRQLTQGNFPHEVERAVQAAGLKPSALRIEITETALMDSPYVAAEVLHQLRAFGVKVYLDDFGTGCSSLSHLHKLPVDALKIDRSFVRSIVSSERPAIVESILALARTMQTSVVAEGIEKERQAEELERLGCTHAQGYLFSPPLPRDAAEELIMAHQPLGTGLPERDGFPALEWAEPEQDPSIACISTTGARDSW